MTRTRRRGLLFIKALPAMAVGLRANSQIQAAFLRHTFCARLAVVPAQHQGHLHQAPLLLLEPRLALRVEDVRAIAHGLAPALVVPTMAVVALLAVVGHSQLQTQPLGTFWFSCTFQIFLWVAPLEDRCRHFFSLLCVTHAFEPRSSG